MKAKSMNGNREYRFAYLLGNSVDTRDEQNISHLKSSIRHEERKKLGQELHDNVNQILGTVGLLTDMLTPGTDREADIRRRIKEYILLAVNEIRTLSGDMVRGDAPCEDLTGSIRKITDTLRYTTSMEVSFNYESEVELLDADAKLCLLRVAQEQIKNVINHSQATKLMIVLYRTDNAVVLKIQDNGKGFDINTTSEGIGLRNIYDRVAAHHGMVDIRSAVGEGCTLVVRVGR